MMGLNCVFKFFYIEGFFDEIFRKEVGIKLSVDI